MLFGVELSGRPLPPGPRELVKEGRAPGFLAAQPPPGEGEPWMPQRFVARLAPQDYASACSTGRLAKRLCQEMARCCGPVALWHVALVAIVESDDDVLAPKGMRRLAECLLGPGASLPVFCVAATPKKGLGSRSALQLPGERLYHLLPAARHGELERWETAFECGELLDRLNGLALVASQEGVPQGAATPPPPRLLSPAALYVQALAAWATGLKCEVFGSVLARTAGRESDVDLTLLELESVQLHRDHAACTSALEQAGAALQAHGFFVERCWQPRVPLLRVRAWDGAAVEITAYNHLGHCNSLLLREYAVLSPRFAQLARAAKDWTRARGFLGSVHGGLSSYSVSLLSLFYVMVRGREPVPNLQVSVEAPDCWLHDTRGRAWRASFRLSRPEERAELDVTETAAQLLAGFFEFYSAFDWRREVVQPALLRRGVPLDRAAAAEYAASVTPTPLDAASLQHFLGEEYCVFCPLEASLNTARFATKFGAVLAAMRQEVGKAAS